MALNPRKRLGHTAGQALAETAIGLSLMAFAWSLTFYAGYMVNHAGKCAVAARHAAWAKGNGAAVSVDSLRSDIFGNNLPLVSLQTTSDSTSDASGMLSGNAIMRAILEVFPDIQKADVTFGLVGDAEPSTWPFVLMNTQFPFMPESKLPDLMSVSTHAEWDTVSERWDSISGMFKSIVEGMF